MKEEPDCVKVDEVISACAHTRGHILHFYASNADKHAVHASVIAMAEKALYITSGNQKEVAKKFAGGNNNGAELKVAGPRELYRLVTDEQTTIVVDAGAGSSSEIMRREKHLSNRPHGTLMCAYPLAGMDKALIQKLVACHDKLILTTEDTTMLSSASLSDDADLSDESIERHVKGELEPIVLALLANRPMHGIEIIKAVHKNFGVLLSPGTIYPLLHKLEKDGLLKKEYGIKTKKYSALNREEIRMVLGRRIKVNKLFNRFLMSNNNGPESEAVLESGGGEKKEKTW